MGGMGADDRLKDTQDSGLAPARALNLAQATLYFPLAQNTGAPQSRILPFKPQEV
jgi:hypothetical protein